MVWQRKNVPEENRRKGGRARETGAGSVKVIGHFGEIEGLDL